MFQEKASSESSLVRNYLRVALTWLGWMGVGLSSIWAVAALYFDFPSPDGRVPLAFAYLVVLAFVLFRVRGTRWKILASYACFTVVAIWWFSLKPSDDRHWMADVAKTAWGEVNGETVTLHNVRNCDYRTELDYTCAWQTRTYDLTQLRGGDLFLDNWGSPWIAHPIVSFDFGRGGHLAMSIETRKTVGQSYSALLGFFRQYTLIVIPSDERDVVRLRTNYRVGENLYLYHTKGSPKVARELLLDYLDRINELHTRPEWYNALTTNCTTVIFNQAAMRRQKWDWRILLNGKLDELEYGRGTLETGGLSFTALKQQAWINPAAKAADQSAMFSELIRQGRVGF